MNPLIKLAAAAALFAGWGAIVLTHNTAAPGADTLISWLQAALVSLGAVHLATGPFRQPAAPAAQSAVPAAQPENPQ